MAKYISLHAVVDNIAKGLATADPGQYSNPDSATAAARQLLVQALYDGVLVAEGDSKELVAPDSPEPGRGISGARQTIPPRYWANESRQETTLSGDGAATTVLDLVIVHWSADSISGDDDYGDYELQNVRLVLEALQRLALLAPPTLPNSCDTEPMRLARNSALSDELTYFTGAPGRPTSTHLVEAEMRRRFAASRHLPCGWRLSSCPQSSARNIPWRRGSRRRPFRTGSALCSGSSGRRSRNEIATLNFGIFFGNRA